MKNHSLLLFIIFALINSNALLHGMEENLEAIMKPVNDLCEEQAIQFRQGNSEKVKELQKEITKERNELIIKNKHLLVNETYVLSNKARHIIASSEIKYPLIIKTNNFPTNNDSFQSLITVLHARYDNNNQYAAITNYALNNLVGNKENKEKHQCKIKESCEQVLQEQNETNKIIRANFFLITSNNSKFGDHEYYQYCPEHTYALRNIIKTELKNICKTTTLHYEHEKFKNEEVIVTLHPEKANLKIGYVTLIDI